MFSTLRKQAQKGFTLVELMIVVAIIGILAAVAIPAFTQYINKSRSTEAREMIKKIHDGARQYYLDTPQPTITPVPAQFPAPTTAISPATSSCCDAGGNQVKCVPATFAGLWTTGPDATVWQAVHFAMDDPFLYSYQYDLTAADAFTARAIGDLDCDTVLSTFELLGAVDATTGTPTSGGNINRVLENE